MARRKTDRADLRTRYPLYAQLGLAAALLVCTLAFRVAWNPMAAATSLASPPSDAISVTEITPTTQRPDRPPPPPLPLPPVAVPDHTVLDAPAIDFDSVLDAVERQPAQAPPEPPAPEVRDEPFIAVEEMPQLVGGLAALAEAVEYPAYARQAGIEGTVYVQFIVDEEGRVTEPTVLRSPHQLLSEEALRVIEEMRFTPGRQRGKAVRVKMSLPVRFELR